MNKKRLGHRLLFFWSLLLIPLVVSLFTTEIQWNAYDFLTAALLLSIGAWCMERILQSRQTKHIKNIAMVVLLILLLLLWTEMAVGLFGSPLAGY